MAILAGMRRWVFGLMAIITVVLALPASGWGQTFEPIPALSFSKTFGRGDPLPQMISIASTGANFTFTAAATSTTGGNWLTITPGSFGCCASTPYAVQVNANPLVTLARGRIPARLW